ncbi:hypothetical protein BH10ACI3_BH10ACI3_27800 [soil metagenome]
MGGIGAFGGYAVIGRNMEELLKQLLGKKIDVTCGTNATFRGDVVDVKAGVLYLRDEEGEVAYVAIDKIAVIYECKDPHVRPGFLG